MYKLMEGNMKKLIKILAVIVVLLVAIGYGVYYFGTDIASDKIVEELENSGQLDKAKQYVENNSELKQFLSEAENVDPEQLPFSTKEDATRVVIEKVGVSELSTIQAKAQEGSLTKEDVLQTLQENFTEEEILALKSVIYNELY
jgi:flagellar basal body-associated protein FliL